MVSGYRWLALCISLWVVACGGGGDGDTVGSDSGTGDGSTTGDTGSSGSDAITGDTPFIDTDATPSMPPLYAVQLTREIDGSIIVDSVDYLAAKDDAYRPVPAGSGDFVAVAKTGDSIVDAVPVFFAETFVAERFEGDTLDLVLDASGTVARAQTRIFIDATAVPKRIDIVDASGNVVSSITELPAASASSTSTSSATQTGTRLARSKRPFAAYPWIELLDETDTHPIITELSTSGLWTLTDGNIADLEAALDALPRRLVSAIDTLGVAILSRPGITYGGHVFLDLDVLDFERGRQVYLIAHEAGHAYHNVSASVGGNTFAEWSSNWPGDVIAAVQETHRRMGIDKDVLSFWSALHASAVDAGIAAPYRGADSSPYSAGALLSGFVTDYASERLVDDFADTVAIANFATVQSLSPTFSSGTCSRYQLGLDLDRLTALAYTKLRLVEQMGLATEDDVHWCVGDSAPTQTPGITLGDALYFGQALNAGYTGEDRQQFNIVGQDASGRGLAIELATEGRHPTGVYPLDLTWWGNWDGNNTLVIASPTPSEARTASSGVVVVTYASSSDRVDGFVFDLHLRSALGPASAWGYVPFRVEF